MLQPGRAGSRKLRHETFPPPDRPLGRLAPRVPTQPRSPVRVHAARRRNPLRCGHLVLRMVLLDLPLAYAYTLASRIEDWIRNLVLLVITVWLIRAGRSLLGRRASEGRGLLATGTLRIWGVLFAVAPIAIVVLATKTLVHFHILLGFWTAAGACFLLASKRAQFPASETVS